MMTPLIGRQLREAREARRLSLEDVARATHMRAHYLQALEAEDFTAIPSAVQARGFLRAYADFLGLPSDRLLHDLDSAQSPPQAAAPETPAQPPQEVEKTASQEKTAEADEIFRSIGVQLKHQRELLGISLDDVERHTHLRRHYLVALESGSLDDLPSPVQGRGMLSNYAAFLGINPEPLLLRFAEGLQSRLEASRQPRPERTKPVRQATPGIPVLRRLFSGDLLVGTFLVVTLVAFMIWGVVRIFSLGTAEETAVPTAPSIADVLLATETATPTASPAPPSPTIPEAPEFLPPTPTDIFAELPPEDGNGNAPTDEEGQSVAQNVTVYVTVRQRTWMRVLVDGDIQFEGRVLPGSAYSYTGEERIEILTGNGAGLQIFFNEQDLGVLGFFGQVVERIFTIDGVQTPTPTVTPTGTATPATTATPARSPTPAGTLPALP